MKNIFISALFLLLILPVYAKNPEVPSSYAFTRGLEAYEAEQYQDAYDWFLKETNDNPNNGYAFVYMGILNYVNKENGRALSALENALKKLPKKENVYKGYALETRAMVYEAMQDTVKALDDLALAIKLNPRDLDYYKHRAQLYFEQKKYDLSNADYQQMINIDSGNTFARMGIGRNSLYSGNTDEAISHFDYVIRLEPNYSSAYSWRAEANMEKQNWAAVTDDILTALELDGDDKAFQLMINLPEEAVNIIKPKLKIKMTKAPNSRYWPYCYAAIEHNNNNFEEAIFYYEKTNSLDPAPIVFSKIADCYENLENYPAALINIERAIAMAPDEPEYISHRADINKYMGNFAEAVADRTLYISAYPEYGLAYLLRGHDNMNAGNYKDAIEDYDMALALVPWMENFSTVHKKRGDAYKFLGNNAKAAEEYNKILEIESSDTLNAYSGTPFALSGLGQNKEAEEVMEKILAGDTITPGVAQINAALLYSRTGKADKAIDHLQKARELGEASLGDINSSYDFNPIRQQINEIFFPVPMVVEVDDDDLFLENRLLEYVEVPFTKENGVTKVKCTINDLPLYFVFDTGAADVTLSMVEANFMLKNDYIKPEDFIGTARYMDANGDISEGAIVNLRNVNFGGLEIENVRAGVVRNQKAPLLLGQSVLGRLGKFEIDNAKQVIKITHYLDE